MSEYKKGRYTKEELKTIEEMIKNNKTIKEISEYLNRDYFSVHSKVRHMRLKPRKDPRYNYKFEVGEIVNGLKILKQIRYNNEKGYVVKSLAYPNDKNDYKVTEGNLRAGRGCPYSSKPLRKVIEENSLWSKVEYRKYIINEDEAKKTAPYSNKPIYFKCICGKVKKMKPYTLLLGGISCVFCSKGTSYGHLCFYSYSRYFNLYFKDEVVLSDLSNRRIDFINSHQMVEIQGMGHYQQVANWDFEATQQADREKENYCASKGLEFIALDMRYSNWKQFKKSINNCSSLPTITTKDEKHILKIMELNRYHPIREYKDLYNYGFSTYEIGEKYNCNASTIADVLRKNNITIRKGGSSLKGRYNLKTSRAVRCINTNQTFKSATKAKEWATQASKISECCQGKRNYAGKHPITGEKLRWEYID